MSRSTVRIDPFDEVLAAFGRGDMVIICDDEDRENEGDLTLASQWVTEEALAFMMREARGLICVSMGQEVAERLNLPLQVLNNNSPFQTPFTVSVDHRDVVDTGITAAGRARTIRGLIDPAACDLDFVSPGMVFPLVAHPSGVLGRAGQTEGSYELARLAGLNPSGIICEILNEDGTMARGEQLVEFARRHRMLTTSVAEIARHRVLHEVLVRRTAVSDLATDFGVFRAEVYLDDVDSREHLLLRYGDPTAGPSPLVRIHSECLTGDVFGSMRCDCGEQLAQAMQMIVEEGSGIILYLRQEGRGIGLTNKLRAYQLQDQGHDTVEANVKLGFSPDERDFAVAAKLLTECGVSSARVITNNPRKLETLERLGIAVSARVPVRVAPTSFSRAYLDAKREKLGHLL